MFADEHVVNLCLEKRKTLFLETGRFESGVFSCLHNQP